LIAGPATGPKFVLFALFSPNLLTAGILVNSFKPLFLFDLRKRLSAWIPHNCLGLRSNLRSKPSTPLQGATGWTLTAWQWETLLGRELQALEMAARRPT
jgi:hypothetical protein